MKPSNEENPRKGFGERIGFEGFHGDVKPFAPAVVLKSGLLMWAEPWSGRFLRESEWFTE